MKAHNTPIKRLSRFSPFFRLRIYCIILFILAILIGFVKSTIAQTNAGRIEIPSKKVFQLDKYTLIADELIMGDSSTLELTGPTTYIKANRIVIGSGCQIIGIGSNGTNGKNGKSSSTPMGLCKAGGNGEAGNPGLDGAAGKDIILDAIQFDIHGLLNIDIHGGNGGDGGNGGKGSHGGQTTVHCIGNGGNGGNGANGGNGGKGGTLSILVQTTEPSELVAKINLINRGGYRGLGGEGGKGGPRGTGPSESKSKLGLNGKPGIDGQYGKDSKPLFYSIAKKKSDQLVETLTTSAHGQ